MLCGHTFLLLEKFGKGHVGCFMKVSLTTVIKPCSHFSCHAPRDPEKILRLKYMSSIRGMILCSRKINDDAVVLMIYIELKKVDTKTIKEPRLNQVKCVEENRNGCCELHLAHRKLRLLHKNFSLI